MIKVDGNVIYFEGFPVAHIRPRIGATERMRFAETFEKVADVEELKEWIGELEERIEELKRQFEELENEK